MGLHPVTSVKNLNYWFMSGVYDRERKKASSSFKKNLPFARGKKKPASVSGPSCFELSGGFGAGLRKSGEGLGKVHFPHVGMKNLTANTEDQDRAVSLVFFDEVFQEAGRLHLELLHGGGPLLVEYPSQSLRLALRCAPHSWR